MSITDISNQAHHWVFIRRGGVNQVLLRDAADLRALGELDTKLWMALAMPVNGIALDAATLSLLDTDNDGSIRPPEILAAVRWINHALKDPAIIFQPGASLPLDAISDPELAAIAQRVLRNLGRPDADSVHLTDVTDLNRLFSATKLNGDGIIPADSADTPESAQAIKEILSVLPGKVDRGGQPGVDADTVNQFFNEAQALCDWDDRQAPPELVKAANAVRAIAAKADDYFARCRTVAFDPQAAAALNLEKFDYSTLATRLLTAADAEIEAMPLAAAAPGQPLPLTGAVNPAWAARLATLATDAATPLLDKPCQHLTEAEWQSLKQAVAATGQWLDAKPQTPVEKLGLPRLRELLGGSARKDLMALIERDAAMRPEYERVAQLEKLIRFRRDLGEVLINMVNFTDFYGNTQAVFQAGVLYLDARACELCIEVTDPARHALLAGLSGAFLMYCTVTRAGGQQKNIVAVVTNGDSDNLMVGRNGVFYDREGRDWLATVTRIVSNPISVREAFWMPYKKLVRIIEEQIVKRAQAADEDSTAKLSGKIAQMGQTDQTADKPLRPPQRIDLGTIALFGTAIGGVSALVAGFLKMLFGLGFWLPLGVLGVLLLISGPSMLLASMKLRLRNLGPLLDASGWAVNTRARINIPFGASLTHLSTLPPGSHRIAVDDPFADKKRVRLFVLMAILGALIATCWASWKWPDTFDRIWRRTPGSAQKTTAGAQNN
ncbi:MAG: hypothetical protein ACOYCD_00850 [Kiritimatiellia bacterium]|jgi:hypothetical protein